MLLPTGTSAGAGVSVATPPTSGVRPPVRLGGVMRQSFIYSTRNWPREYLELFSVKIV